MEPMTHGSLFSGIGGFDLAAEWMGWENVFHCEINPFGQRVLKHYWPNAKLYNDITQTDFTIHRGRIDILSGGFPCQPFSQAGQRKGIEDSRHLWPQMLRSIREIQPKWILGENVYGIVNWNGGLVFDQVCADLEAEGYEIQPVILPACAINAPHRRDRVWFIAYRTSELQQGNESGECGNNWEQDVQQEHGKADTIKSGAVGENGNATNSHINGFNGSNGKREIHTSQGGINAQHDVEQICNVSDTYKCGLQGISEKEKRKFTAHRNTWDIFPTQSPICSGNDGVPGELDGITFSKWRKESIKAYGNAVVPQLVYEIFKVIEKMETWNQ